MGTDSWHVVSFTDEQTDLMPSFFKIAQHLPRLRLHGADVSHVISYCRDGMWVCDPDWSQKTQRIEQASERLCVETGKKPHELAEQLQKAVYEIVCEEKERMTKSRSREEIHQIFAEGLYKVRRLMER